MHVSTAAASDTPRTPAPHYKRNEVTAVGEIATSEGSTTTGGVHASFLCDSPVRDGGRGEGACPVDHLLGAIVGCSQATMNKLVFQQKLQVGKVHWKADTKYDVFGIKGRSGSSPHLTEFNIVGEVETDMSQAALDVLAEEVGRRCVVAATVKRSGAPFVFHLVPRQIV
eukprot:gene31279-6424_t